MRANTLHDEIREIAESMKKFGVTKPILVDRNGVVVAGHGCLEALKLLGQKRVHVIRLEHLTEAQVRAYRLADNKLAETRVGMLSFSGSSFVISRNSLSIATFRSQVFKRERSIFFSRILTKAALTKATRFRRSMKPHRPQPGKVTFSVSVNIASVAAMRESYALSSA